MEPYSTHIELEIAIMYSFGLPEKRIKIPRNGKALSGERDPVCNIVISWLLRYHIAALEGASEGQEGSRGELRMEACLETAAWVASWETLDYDSQTHR